MRTILTLIIKEYKLFWSDRVAVNLNWLPCAPRADTTCVSVVPSPNEHVTVSGLAPGGA